MKEKYIDSSEQKDRLHLYIWMQRQPKPGAYRSDDTWYGGTYGAL